MDDQPQTPSPLPWRRSASDTVDIEAADGSPVAFVDGRTEEQREANIALLLRLAAQAVAPNIAQPSST